MATRLSCPRRPRYDHIGPTFQRSHDCAHPEDLDFGIQVRNFPECAQNIQPVSSLALPYSGVNHMHIDEEPFMIVTLFIVAPVHRVMPNQPASSKHYSPRAHMMANGLEKLKALSRLFWASLDVEALGLICSPLQILCASASLAYAANHMHLCLCFSLEPGAATPASQVFAKPPPMQPVATYTG
eukprot:245216-Pelagomonas_calceolata.AAC.6